LIALSHVREVLNDSHDDNDTERHKRKRRDDLVVVYYQEMSSLFSRSMMNAGRTVMIRTVTMGCIAKSAGPYLLRICTKAFIS
jgi:hypothetical protein